MLVLISHEILFVRCRSEAGRQRVRDVDAAVVFSLLASIRTGVLCCCVRVLEVGWVSCTAFLRSPDVSLSAGRAHEKN